jgi:SAM-dependent methyltransferase
MQILHREKHKICGPVHLFSDSSDLDALEETSCPLCHSSDSFNIHSFARLNIVSCKQCGLAYLNPRLKELIIKDAYRGGNYFINRADAGYEDYSFQENSLRVTFRRFLKELYKRGMTSDRLLEVGCGYGYFLDEAKDFFSYRAGAELSQEAASHARKLSGADIYAEEVCSLTSEVSNIGLCVLINVIEHIYSPVDFLISLKTRLRDGGLIVVATPDIGSFWYKIMNKRWPSFKIPEHVAFYSAKTLKLLLQKAGFADFQELPFPHAFPLGLITRKLGIKLPTKFGRQSVWLPRTMTALSARSFRE